MAGKGVLSIEIDVITSLLGCHEKSVYRWLQSGRKARAFRRYQVRRGILKVWLGSLFKVCYQLNLKNWGAVGYVPVTAIGSSIRPLTTGIAIQRLQQGSRYKANQQLKPDYRREYGAPRPNELLKNQESSLKPAPGQIPCVLHVSSKKIFVSKNFIHYGVSQKSVSWNLGIHPRTVQRHVIALDLDHKQICQKKADYSQLAYGLKHEAPEYWGFQRNQSTNIGYRTLGDTVEFSDGFPLGRKKATANVYNIPKVDFINRIFKMGRDWWLARCNVYAETFTLTTMHAARKDYKQQLAQLAQCKNPKKPSAGGAPDL